MIRIVRCRVDGYHEEAARSLRLAGRARPHHPLGAAELQRRLPDLPAPRPRRLDRHLCRQDRRLQHTDHDEPVEQDRQRAFPIRRYRPAHSIVLSIH